LDILETFFGIFLGFFGNFLFWRIVLGGFFWRNSLGGITQKLTRNCCFCHDFGVILSPCTGRRKEGRILILRIVTKLIALKKQRFGPTIYYRKVWRILLSIF
jgi:hypothetical protein